MLVMLLVPLLSLPRLLTVLLLSPLLPLLATLLPLLPLLAMLPTLLELPPPATWLKKPKFFLSKVPKSDPRVDCAPSVQ